MQRDTPRSVFTNSEPQKRGPKHYAETDFGYLNEHCDPPVLAIRATLDEWLHAYPDEAKLDLVQRLRSPLRGQHLGAFWELYLHALFLRLGFAIEVHAQVAGSTARPDLLLLRDGIPAAMVECRLAGMPAASDESMQRLKAELYDALNQLVAPNHFLWVHDLESSHQRPSFKPLLKQVEGWLSGLDPDDPAARDYETSPSFEWREGDWYLRLGAIPKSPDSRGKNGVRAVGSTGTEARWLNTVGEIHTALSEKSEKYGDLGIPFLIAVNQVGMHCDHTDWCDALFGRPATTVSFHKDGTIAHQQPFRKNDGFWSRDGRPRKRHVSGILAGWYIAPHTAAAHQISIYEHFDAERPLGVEFDLPRWHLPPHADRLDLRPGRGAPETLGLAHGWPGFAHLVG